MWQNVPMQTRCASVFGPQEENECRASEIAMGSRARICRGERKRETDDEHPASGEHTMVAIEAGGGVQVSVSQSFSQCRPKERTAASDSCPENCGRRIDYVEEQQEDSFH